MKISRAALWLIVFLSGMTFGAGRAFAQKPAAKMTVSYSAAAVSTSICSLPKSSAYLKNTVLT